jgi:hypothetical protein
MCERCNEIMQQILHHCRFMDQRFDPLTEQRVTEAIKKVEERKRPRIKGRLVRGVRLLDRLTQF